MTGKKEEGQQPGFLVVLLFVIISWGIVMLVVNALSCACGLNSSEKNSPERIESSSEGGNKLEAWAYAQLFVEQDLKDPRKAKFEFGAVSKGSVKYIGNNTYSVKSYVDAPNSFGANVRTRFSLKIRDNGGSWSVVDGITYDDGMSYDFP